MLRITNAAVKFDDTSSLEAVAAKRLQVKAQDVASVAIVRKTLDARRYHGAAIQFVYQLDVALKNGAKTEKAVLAHLRRDKNVALRVEQPH